VAKRTRCLIIAILLTALDAAVVLRCGGSIGTAWSGIIWAGSLMIPLAALCGDLARQCLGPRLPSPIPLDRSSAEGVRTWQSSNSRGSRWRD
jgi:hypothetical protein